VYAHFDLLIRAAAFSSWNPRTSFPALPLHSPTSSSRIPSLFAAPYPPFSFGIKLIADPSFQCIRAAPSSSKECDQGRRIPRRLPRHLHPRPAHAIKDGAVLVRGSSCCCVSLCDADGTVKVGGRVRPRRRMECMGSECRCGRVRSLPALTLCPSLRLLSILAPSCMRLKMAPRGRGNSLAPLRVAFGMQTCPRMERWRRGIPYPTQETFCSASMPSTRGPDRGREEGARGIGSSRRTSTARLFYCAG
jgi:hypothetical protein